MLEYKRTLMYKPIIGSALTTLSITIGEVGAWLFALWACIDWFLHLDDMTEAYMKATFQTGLEALAVLWAKMGEQPRHPPEISRSLGL